MRCARGERERESFFSFLFWSRSETLFISLLSLSSLFSFSPRHFPQFLMAASRAGGASLASRLRAFVDSPTGLKTTHFWGPVANWGFVLAVSDLLCGIERGGVPSPPSFGFLRPWKKSMADFAHVLSLSLSFPTLGLHQQGLADSQKPAELISPNMTGGETF